MHTTMHHPFLPNHISPFLFIVCLNGNSSISMSQKPKWRAFPKSFCFQAVSSLFAYHSLRLPWGSVAASHECMRAGTSLQQSEAAHGRRGNRSIIESSHRHQIHSSTEAPTPAIHTAHGLGKIASHPMAMAAQNDSHTNKGKS